MKATLINDGQEHWQSLENNGELVANIFGAVAFIRNDTVRKQGYFIKIGGSDAFIWADEIEFAERSYSVMGKPVKEPSLSEQREMGVNL